MFKDVACHSIGDIRFPSLGSFASQSNAWEDQVTLATQDVGQVPEFFNVIAGERIATQSRIRVCQINRNECEQILTHFHYFDSSKHLII